MNKSIQTKLDEGRQYRHVMGFDVSDDMVVEGYATTFSQPYELFRDGEYIIYEQIDPDAFREADMGDVIMQYNHEGRVFARSSNGTLELTPDEHGLKVRADLSGTEIGRQLYEEIKGGYTDKMSFGFKVAADKREQTQRDGNIEILRTITKIEKLYDVSAVSIPANDATSISARSDGEGVIAEAKQEMLAQQERERQKQKIRILTEVQNGN